MYYVQIVEANCPKTRLTSAEIWVTLLLEDAGTTSSTRIPKFEGYPGPWDTNQLSTIAAGIPLRDRAI